jgi:hypothetical protein
MSAISSIGLFEGIESPNHSWLDQADRANPRLAVSEETLALGRSQQQARDYALFGGVRGRIARGRSRYAVLPAFPVNLKTPTQLFREYWSSWCFASA